MNAREEQANTLMVNQRVLKAEVKLWNEAMEMHAVRHGVETKEYNGHIIDFTKHTYEH